MRKSVKIPLIVSVFVLGLGVVLYGFPKINWNPGHRVGEVLDSLNGVKVYYNGGVGHVESRHTADGYNLGLRYQCVEFVKRYYYERFHHRMPDAYGHAKDFFDPALADGALNGKRNLLQFRNGGETKPAPEDLAVFAPTIWNRYGHVAIVSRVTDAELEIIQQNPGPFGSPRETFALQQTAGRWTVADERFLGWLRKDNR